MAMALFIWFSAHYIFNLEYHKYKDAAMLIQEFIVELPECDMRLIKEAKSSYGCNRT